MIIMEKKYIYPLAFFSGIGLAACLCATLEGIEHVLIKFGSLKD